jgi:hypothetical protein
MALKAATATAAAVSALGRLTDAARRGLDMDEVLDLLPAARSTLDALCENADLVGMAAGVGDGGWVGAKEGASSVHCARRCLRRLNATSP